jgi:hypothetical protein
MSQRVEVVTTCIGYGDFLAETLIENLPLIDDMVVVTSPEDEETQLVCRKNDVRYIMTEDHRKGGKFAKGRLINRGFDQLSCQDWILHCDADIVLPRKFRRLLEWSDLDTRCIYGADRQRVIGWDEWKALKRYVGQWDNHTHEMGHFWHPNYKPMSRLVSSLHGYTPIGAFQLFHGSELIQYNSHVRSYPVAHGDAARTDHQFSLLWDRKFRQLLPEIILLHLESEAGTHGANWCGRTTKRFGPEFTGKYDPRFPAKHNASNPKSWLRQDDPGRRHPEPTPVQPSHPHEPPKHPHPPEHHHPEPPRHRREES